MSYGYYQPTYNTGAMPDMLGQYRQIQQPQVPQVQQASSGMIWVQGETAAKAYLVAPGNTVVLWDSEQSVIYLKSADATGMPTMKVLEYNERMPRLRPQNEGVSQAVTMDMFNELKSKYEALAAKMSELLTEKGVTENE